MAENENERTVVETEIQTMSDKMHWRCRAVTVGPPKNTKQIRIVCRDDEHQLVKKVVEAKILDLLGLKERDLCASYVAHYPCVSLRITGKSYWVYNYSPAPI